MKNTYNFPKMNSKNVESIGIGRTPTTTPTKTKPSGWGTKEYEMIRKIGEGSTSEVWLVRRKKKLVEGKDEMCALKAIRLSGTKEEDGTGCEPPSSAHTTTPTMGIGKMIANELASLHRLDRSFPFIAHLCGPERSGGPGWFLVPLEYVSGGNLYEHVLEFGALGEARSRLYAAELGCTLDYLHANRIIFRDLKTENILLGSDGHLKLTDFGLSTIPTRGRATTICGTPHTIAPEIVRREEYDHRVDWYSLGACLFECLTGHAPFASLSTDLSALLHSIIHREPRLPKQLSSTCRALLVDLLAKDPNRRISSVDQLLNHPWFTNLSTPFTKEHILKKSFQPSFLPIPSPHRLSKSSFPTPTSSSSTTSSSSSQSFSVSSHSFSDSASSSASSTSSDDDHNHSSDSSALVNHHLFLPPHSPSSSLNF
ncbi:hypothetical protein PGT21_016015 [Puccinia graminis f. sp. tritici]|uniref:Protein kinase domain-containing protein n=1 Tax=Puccinia graminis f. sp. tritici TaxID=56615 RepID=A0A5B0MUI7_PUCGR|nr:hypothetical protein PGT21_016015 [Puccinia graminis f. sp. tritici]KAA1131613.1 hypothetical protein PGTUg99_033390 [Puccinia graminis f. sp. tritici]